MSISSGAVGGLGLPRERGRENVFLRSGSICSNVWAETRRLVYTMGMSEETERDNESMADRLAAWRDSVDDTAPSPPAAETPDTVWLQRPGHADIVPPGPRTMKRPERPRVPASRVRIVRRCVVFMFALTAVSWLLAFLNWGRGETAYAWLVVVPLHLSVFLPGRMLWRCLASRAPFGWSDTGVIVCTFAVNCLLGLLLGFFLCGIRQYIKGVRRRTPA
jgi:hypothetical protein